MDFSLQLKRAQASFQTKTSPKISPREVAELCLEVGWTPAEAVIAVAVCGAESGFRIKAINVNKSGRNIDYGLFQISLIHKPTEQQQYDPQENIKLAYKIYQDAQKRGKDGFTPWVAYKNGKYLQFLPTAESAVNEALRLEGSIDDEGGSGHSIWIS